MTPGKKKNKARQYFIDLQRWRSLVALIAFELVEGSTLITRRYSIQCLIPFFIYSLVYVVMVVVIGEERGG